MKLMQFLMGLDDSYMQIRSSILSREVLPDVRSDYATISSEESHKVTSGSVSGSSLRNQASAIVSNVPNRGNFQRGQSSNTAPRPNNLNNNKQSGGSGLVCENCWFNGHTIDRCFKIIGYPADFRKKKSGQPKVSVNGKIVNSEANQHMTNGDKELDNVYDISHLKIKVAHPNGTEAFISNIGNLKLPNGLVLFDVLVIPEYYPMLNVLKDNLGIENKIQTEFCETCQRAKKTRESFPLSHHNSSKLGDLIHLDLWGAYKVTSSEGFRLPSSVLNEKSPYEMIYKKNPTLSDLRVFGCLCFATILNNHDKLGSRSEKCVPF
ncbi:hypothetical protein Tco_0386526 [Tanacetum coccineum]